MSAEPSQRERILDRLQRGPVTTAELAGRAGQPRRLTQERRSPHYATTAPQKEASPGSVAKQLPGLTSKEQYLMTSTPEERHAAVIAAADDHDSLTGLVIDSIANLIGTSPYHLRNALRESGTWAYPRFHRGGCNWITDRGTLCARTGHRHWPAGLPLCAQHEDSFRAEVANWLEQGCKDFGWVLAILRGRANSDPGLADAARAAFGTSSTEVHDALQAVWS